MTTKDGRPDFWDAHNPHSLELSDWDQESPFLGEVDDWVSGDPIFGLTYTGKNDPDALISCPETQREDAIFATLAEVAPERQAVYLDTLQRTACLTARGRRCLTARGRRDIETIQAGIQRDRP